MAGQSLGGQPTHGHITDPAADDGLALRELPAPEPGRHDLLVRVGAYGLNRGELALLEQRPDGWRPGQDIAGTIAVGAADGTGPPAGTRVVGVADGGGWSTEVALPSHRVAPLPDAVSVEQAAALPVACLTALRTLRQGGSLLGARILVTGASGGVGNFAVQLAAAAGAEVTALVSGEHRTQAVRGLGARHIATGVDEDSGPFDLVLDGVGGPVLAEAIHHLTPAGTLVAYGLAGDHDRTPLAFYDFAAAPLARLVGFFIYATGEDTFATDLALLADLVARGTLDPQLGSVRDWTETTQAVHALRRRTVTGKTVLTIPSATRT